LVLLCFSPPRAAVQVLSGTLVLYLFLCQLAFGTYLSIWNNSYRASAAVWYLRVSFLPGTAAAWYLSDSSLPGAAAQLLSGTVLIPLSLGQLVYDTFASPFYLGQLLMPPFYLEQLFIIPMWVDIRQLTRDPVVLAHPQRMDCYKT
jgi:hypothetical protein